MGTLIVLFVLSTLVLIFIGWVTNEGEGAFVGFIFSLQFWTAGVVIFVAAHFIQKYW